MAKSKPTAKRTWLNPQPSRLSSVSFSFSPNGGNADFVISDCNRKVRIHDYMHNAKDKRNFIKKIRKIEDHAKELADMVEDWEIPKNHDDWL